MQADSSNKVSFFDDDDLSIRFEFKKATKAHQKDLNHPCMLKNNLIKQLPNSPNQQEGFYALHNKTLAWYKNSSSKTVEGVLELAHCKAKHLTPVNGNTCYGFSLSKNGNTYEFYSPNKQVIEDWMNALKTICVLTCFHEEYKALKMIGKGSFAKVYLVESKSNSKMYAVKAFTKESVIASNKANAKPSMLNEIEIMRAFDHENIIKLYEVHESEKSIYLVLELIQGKSLQDVLKKPTFREEYSEVKVVNMIRSILDALAYLASKGVMHRDLKPDNILLDKDCKIKIADFGLATFVDVSEYIFKKCGTPGYIAPEVFKYDQKNPVTNYDYQCDVFSAGCILFYMLFGYPFFEASNASEILRLNRKFTSEFDAIHTVRQEIKNPNSKISKDGLNLLLQLIETDPKRRITAAQALSHPYFIPVPLGMQKISGSNDLVPDVTPKGGNASNPSLKAMTPKGQNSMKLSQAFGSPSPRTDSLKSPGMKDRFAEKDSLYLDMGRPEMNGKLETLNSASNNNSLLLNRRDSNASVGSNAGHDSFSSFAKNSPVDKRSKSFRMHPNVPNNNQSFLKAALLRNMQKNSSDMPEESKDDNSSPKNEERRNSERLQGRFSSFSSRNSSNSQDNDSEDDGVESPKQSKQVDSGKTPTTTTKRRFQPFAQKNEGDPK